ncbi:hypothetical protein D3C87_1591050 [compost metagenome]
MRAPKQGYMAIINIDSVATKVAMDAKAAISRRRSVIVVSRVRYVFNLFSFCTGVNNGTKRKRILRHIPAPIVNTFLKRTDLKTDFALGA